MDINNLSNTPLDFTLSEKVYKVKRLSVLDLFGEFEKQIKEEYFADIINLAERIKDKKERLEFQKGAVKDIPRGKDLEEAARDKMDSASGGIKILTIALNKCQVVSDEDIRVIMTDKKNASVIPAIMDYIIGSDAEKEEEVLPAGAQVVTEKKT